MSSKTMVIGFLFTASFFNLHGSTIFLTSPNQADGIDQSDFIVADNFTLGVASDVTGITYWTSANVDPYPSQFSNSVGWGIYLDNAGSPGTLLTSGTAASPVLADTGVQILGTEEWTVSFPIQAAALLPSTVYWLGLHEGSYNTPNDGTTVFWDTGTSQLPNSIPAEATADLSGQTGWGTADGNNLAFSLTGNNISLPDDTPEPRMTFPLFIALLIGVVLRKIRPNES